MSNLMNLLGLNKLTTRLHAPDPKPVKAVRNPNLGKAGNVDGGTASNVGMSEEEIKAKRANSYSNSSNSGEVNYVTGPNSDDGKTGRAPGGSTGASKETGQIDGSFSFGKLFAAAAKRWNNFAQWVKGCDPAFLGHPDGLQLTALVNRKLPPAHAAQLLSRLSGSSGQLTTGQFNYLLEKLHSESNKELCDKLVSYARGEITKFQNQADAARTNNRDPMPLTATEWSRMDGIARFFPDHHDEVSDRLLTEYNKLRTEDRLTTTISMHEQLLGTG